MTAGVKRLARLLAPSKLFEEFWQIPFKEFAVRLGLFDHPHRAAVTEDHILTGIFHRTVPPPAQLCLETGAADDALYIANLSAYDAAFGCGARGKDLVKPEVRRQEGRQTGHEQS